MSDWFHPDHAKLEGNAFPSLFITNTHFRELCLMVTKILAQAIGLFVGTLITFVVFSLMVHAN